MGREWYERGGCKASGAGAGTVGGEAAESAVLFAALHVDVAGLGSLGHLDRLPDVLRRQVRRLAVREPDRWGLGVTGRRRKCRRSQSSARLWRPDAARARPVGCPLVAN